MRPRLIGVGVAALAVAIFVVTFAHATLYSTPDETSVPAPHTSGAPTRLRIPALGVSAAVQAVGIAKSGNMAVPSNYTDAGWYRGGTRPGAVGSAVMDGHVDNGLGVPAVFKNIGQLGPGDDIFVDMASGTVHFVVEEVTTYPRERVPVERLFTRADQARLNLITCEGEWVPDSKTYDHRVVVYAVLK